MAKLKLLDVYNEDDDRIDKFNASIKSDQIILIRIKELLSYFQ